ncbi:hypothetical protein SAMN05428977_11251 [Nitrosomonas sp. Nm166]|nr:hypothetical protein SAMN05428977_10361 [Nitrosomonas sp. Nm166]SFF30936.1 hypothetical protein SAMN05428977_11251 [Nitrosomonas sp. Nm166]
MDTIAIFCAIDDFCKGFESCGEQHLLGILAEAASAARGAVFW